MILLLPFLFWYRSPFDLDHYLDELFQDPSGFFERMQTGYLISTYYTCV